MSPLRSSSTSPLMESRLLDPRIIVPSDCSNLVMASRTTTPHAWYPVLLRCPMTHKEASSGGDATASCSLEGIARVQFHCSSVRFRDLRDTIFQLRFYWQNEQSEYLQGNVIKSIVAVTIKRRIISSNSVMSWTSTTQQQLSATVGQHRPGQRCHEHFNNTLSYCLK